MDEAQIYSQALALLPQLVAWRRDLHQHPELGFHERRTAALVAGTLTDLGLEVRTGVAETGVTALIEGGRPGRTLLLRWDMDALPIQEATGAPYASVEPGVMHACGHDGHVAIGLGVARLLAASRGDLRGRVKLVFQPAEEGLGGAARMVAEGLLEDPRPDIALGAHIWNTHSLGWLGIAPGPVMAGGDVLEIHVRGTGGHGANPQLAHDPLVASAHILTALQTVVARNLSPLEAAVVSITQVHGGEAFNVIPADVVMRGTIRTFTPEVRAMVFSRVEQIAMGIASGLGCAAEVVVTPLTPPVVNDPEIAGRVRCVAERLFPEAEVQENERSMVSEDMAFILRAVPGAFLFVGSGNPERGLAAPHHNPGFDFDEAALPRAAALLTAAAIDLLGED